MKYTIKFVNESWGNFNTKISKITSRVMKAWASYWKEKYPQIVHKSDRMALADVLWSYSKAKRHLETKIVIDDINFYFVLDFKNILKGISYQQGNNIIINVSFEKNSEKFYKLLQTKEYWEKIQGTLNHELTHYFDKERNSMEEYHDSNSQSSYLKWVLYHTQQVEMKAHIQQLMPLVKQGTSFIDCLDDMLKKRFKKDYTKLKTTFVKFVKYSYLSYIKHDKDMRNKYWKYIVNDPDFSAQIPNYETIKKFFNALIQMKNEEDRLIQEVPKMAGYRGYTEYVFLQSNSKFFRSFDADGIVSAFKNYIDKCIEHKGIVGV